MQTNQGKSDLTKDDKRIVVIVSIWGKPPLWFGSRIHPSIPCRGGGMPLKTSRERQFLITYRWGRSYRSEQGSMVATAVNQPAGGFRGRLGRRTSGLIAVYLVLIGVSE